MIRLEKSHFLTLIINIFLLYYIDKVLTKKNEYLLFVICLKYNVLMLILMIIIYEYKII